MKIQECCKKCNGSYGGGASMLPLVRACKNIDCPCHSPQEVNKEESDGQSLRGKHNDNCDKVKFHKTAKCTCPPQDQEEKWEEEFRKYWKSLIQNPQELETIIKYIKKVENQAREKGYKEGIGFNYNGTSYQTPKEIYENTTLSGARNVGDRFQKEKEELRELKREIRQETLEKVLEKIEDEKKKMHELLKERKPMTLPYTLIEGRILSLSKVMDIIQDLSQEISKLE